MGERVTNFTLNDGTYTLWNRDLPKEIDYGEGKGKNLYSSHPVYLAREYTSHFHISFLKNSNAMDFILKEDTIGFKIVLLF
jgi:alpha-glucosidase (family GH31 glycosyl hydrolase)